MNWDTIEGNWKQLTGQAKAQWGKLTGDDLSQIAGRRDQLVGKIQERYGVAKEDAGAADAGLGRQGRSHLAEVSPGGRALSTRTPPCEIPRTARCRATRWQRGTGQCSFTAVQMGKGRNSAWCSARSAA